MKFFSSSDGYYVALLEVDPAIFEEEPCECGSEHAHAQAEEPCECGSEHEMEEDDEYPGIILARVVTDANGEVDIQVPSDEDFEKAKAVYEALEV